MTNALRRHALVWLATILAAIPTGCVIIPYRPSAETVHDRAEIANPESLRLSVGPRVFLDEMAKAVSKADPRVQAVDGQTFIDTASPTQDLTLAGLKEPATKTLIQPLQLDFVVLFAQPVDKQIDAKGGMLFYLGFFGLGKGKTSTTYWTAVLDAKTLTLVEQLRSESVGTDAGIGLFYGLFVVSDTSGSAQTDAVRHIVETMAATRPAGPLRVAFLAVEPIATPAQLEAEAEKRDLAKPQWAADRYPKFVTAASPPEGQALVYLYRPERDGLDFMTMDFQAGATDSGALISRLYTGGYYPLVVPAGDLTVRVRPWFNEKLPAPVTLHLDAGAILYLRGGTDRSFWHGTSPTLSLVEADKAAGELVNCRLMPPAREHDIEAERRAELGDLLAQYHVLELKRTGVTYADGQSLPPDYPAAYKWSLITKNSAGRKELAARLTPEQIAEAEKQAAEWRARSTE
jgi:hypothetical protein